jgi:glycosyltransferase involved in cell wall biosynthesis
LKILFISDVYFPRINGVSTSIRTFVKQMQAMGHDVHLIAPDYGVKTEDDAWIKRIPARSIYFDPEDKLMKFGAAIDTLAELRKEKYDLIHIHTPFVAHYLGLKLAHLLDVPTVETYHTFFEDYLHLYLPIIPKPIAKSMARFISRRQCNKVDAIVAPSKPMLHVLREYGITTKGEVVPTGLQAHSFADADGAAFRKKHGIEQDRPMALFVGRVAFEKNIGFLLQMWVHLIKKMPNALLVIAGEGPAEKSLHALSEKLGLKENVKFLGYLDRNTELNACYRSADVFVFSSKSETQGLVLLEAMAQSTPVVAIAELGTKSILIEGEGALIAPDEEIEFANKVERVLSDKKLRKQLSDAGIDYVKTRWTDRAQAERMIDFYQEVVALKQ